MSLSKLRDILRLSTVRQTAGLLVLFSVISLLGWGATYGLVRYEMRSLVDTRLAIRMEQAVVAVSQGEPLPEPGPGQTARLVPAGGPDGYRSRDVGSQNRDTRFLAQTVPAGQIILGEDVEAQEELGEILATGMELSLLATLLATVLVGLWMARRGQARLTTLTEGLARVAGGKLNQPIELAGNDDLAVLAERINLTTARLDTAMTQIRVQSSNIAHDLRTPLARLRATLETALIATEESRAPVSPEVLEEALEQIDRLTGTFEALLRLSRLESGAGHQAFKAVALADVISDVETTFGPVVEDADQTLSVDIAAPGIVLGDKALLIQLFANLLQNALRHGASEQTIRLSLRGRRIVLSDEGLGIPTAEREQVLQPLYQRATARQNEGFGLGLSLVRAIAELHGAELALSDGPGGKGLSVAVDFPSQEAM